jgi:hypothetical protein
MLVAWRKQFLSSKIIRQTAQRASIDSGFLADDRLASGSVHQVDRFGANLASADSV